MHRARRQARHVAESLIYSISCLLHIIHIAGEKSYLFGSCEAYYSLELLRLSKPTVMQWMVGGVRWGVRWGGR